MSTNRYEEAYEKIRLAREAVAAGNTALALSYIEEALALDPGNPDAWIEKMRAAGGTVEDPACGEVYTAGQMPYAVPVRMRLRSSVWSMRFIWSVRRSSWVSQRRSLPL